MTRRYRSGGTLQSPDKKKGGRPRKHASNAARQAAYRQRRSFVTAPKCEGKKGQDSRPKSAAHLWNKVLAAHGLAVPKPLSDPKGHWYMSGAPGNGDGEILCVGDGSDIALIFDRRASLDVYGGRQVKPNGASPDPEFQHKDDKEPRELCGVTEFEGVDLCPHEVYPSECVKCNGTDKSVLLTCRVCGETTVRTLSVPVVVDVAVKQSFVCSRCAER